MKTIIFLKPVLSLVTRPTVLLIPAILFLAGWWIALPPKEKHDHDSDSAAGNTQEWTCSMHPQIRQPSFGLCPICNMDLIPLEAGDGDGGLRELSITPEAAALLDIRVSPVLRAPAEVKIDLFGKIDYNERKIVTTTVRMGGRIDRLYADFTGTTVSKGDEIAQIYSPELYVAQEELIQAARALTDSSSPSVRQVRTHVLNAAREKMRLLELSETQIAAIEKQENPSDHITLLAPQDGIVTHLNVKEGQYVKTGAPLFSIVPLTSVWLKMEAYEKDLPWLRYAQNISFTVDAIPGEEFNGRIAFIDPQLDPKRRVVKVRVNVDNEKRLLKPGMFAKVTAYSKVAQHGRVLDADLSGKWISPMHPDIIKDESGSCDICGMALVPAEEFGFVAPEHPVENPLLVPNSALLRTGQRAVVYVRIPDKYEPVFEGREIVLGARAGDSFIVLDGLDEGELVVTKGAYKLDSELQIKARPSMMNPNAGLEERPASKAPEQVAGQWSPLLRAYGKLEQAVQRGDRSTARNALKTMQQALHRIQHNQLQPEELALWKEFSMRLSNTLTEANGMKLNRSTLARVRQQMQETGRYVGLSWMSQPSVPEDQQWSEPLKQVIAAYLSVSKALSDDSADMAIKAAPQLASTIEALPSGKGHLLSAVKAFQTELEIKPLRKAFQPVSNELIRLIRQHGIDYVGNAYVVHCPMAFGNTGADWLSNDPVVRNPYFGDMMYDCGAVTDTLSLGKIQSTPTQPATPKGGSCCPK